jgi:hypothetical protein
MSDTDPELGSDTGYKFCSHCAKSRRSFFDVCDGVKQIKCRQCGKVLECKGTIKNLVGECKDVYPPKRR